MQQLEMGREHVTFTSGTKLKDVRFLMDDAEAVVEVAAEGKRNEIGSPLPIEVVDSSHGLGKTDSSVYPVQQTQLEPQVPSEAEEGKLWIQAKAGPGGGRMPEITSQTAAVGRVDFAGRQSVHMMGKVEAQQTIRTVITTVAKCLTGGGGAKRGDTVRHRPLP